MKYSFIYEMYMKFTYITELVDVTLAIWKKCYENSKEKHVIKNLINHVRERTELSFYSLYKKIIKYEEAIKEYAAKKCRKQVL